MIKMEKSMDLLLKIYRNVVAIRAFEEAAHEQYANGMLAGSVHLYAGEEGVAAGVCGVLNDNDFITSTHRGHGHLIARRRLEANDGRACRKRHRLLQG